MDGNIISKVATSLFVICWSRLSAKAIGIFPAGFVSPSAAKQAALLAIAASLDQEIKVVAG
jgi:hypothetical protein